MKTYLTIEKEELYQLAYPNPHIGEFIDAIIEKSSKQEVYEFDELSDDAKDKAIETMCDINIDHDWWDSTYNDAADIGFKIEEFDLGRSQSIGGKRLFDMDTICNNVIANHGEHCEAYKLAKSYQEKSALIEDDDDYDDNYNKLTEEFEAEILDCYYLILKKEYEYLQSKEAIIETIKTNEYTFDREGKRL